ncbi:TPA: hypothetical protein DEX28_02195 [Patescibacteria group bacterium]|nr:MAG: hypothetical protein UW89_C0021G0017 [Parcubacteria group bacterium GW2011_GWB1_45_10]HCI05535.1 hypothetical protein [Patescibacteria group bacterium]
MVELIESFISNWGVWGFFTGIILEEIIVPLPSSLVMMAGGFFLVKAGSLDAAFWEVLAKLVLPGALGVTLGSLFFYFLSRWGGELALAKIGPKLGISLFEVEKIRRYFRKHYWDDLVLFGLRSLPIFPGVIVSVIAGLMKMPLVDFLVVGFLGSGVRIMIMGLIGWQAKGAYASLALKFENLSNLVFVGFIFLVVLIYLFTKKQLNRLIK